MESLVEEVEALVAPDLSTSIPDWCENCKILRKDIQRLQEEQGQNFGKLKQKIISTDLLIKKYKAKCEDYDLVCKKMEEVNKKAEKQLRQNSILETQLKAALLDVDPLRKSKAALETEVKEQCTRIQDLTDKVVAFEGTQKQYEYLTKTSSADIEKLDSERKELLSKVKAMEAGKITREAAKEYKVEISSLKKENHILANSEKKLDKKLKAALLKIDSLTIALKEAKSSPGRGRRRTSNSQLSPVKSPLRRTPKGRGVGAKPSPSNIRRTRTTSGREIPVTERDADGIDSDSSVGSIRSDYSSRWTFSPLVKCLSPLPPSPACFSNRKELESDDGVLSDIADEFEQQLAQDFDSCHDDTDDELEDTLEDPQQTKSPAPTECVKTEEEDIEKETRMRESDEIKEGPDLFDLSEYEIPDVKCKIENTETGDQSVKTSPKKYSTHSAETSAAIQDKEEDIHDHSKHSIACKTDEPNVQTDLDIGDSNSDEILNTGVQPEVDHRVKKTRIAHSSKCHDKKQNLEAMKKDTDPVKDTQVLSHTVKMSVKSENKDTEKDKIGSQNGGLENKPVQEAGNTQGEKMKQLPRNDTSEFVPVLDGHLETLSDSDTDSKACPEPSEEMLDCKGDASTVDSQLECANLTEEVEVDMTVEEQVEEVERQYPPTRGTLTRQNNISGEGTHTWKSPESTHRVSNKGKVVKATKDSPSSSHRNKRGMKGKSKFGPHSFIAFKQSSSGTLADELDNLSNDVDYVCNDRSAITAKTENKNVDVTKVKIKKHKKYKDLDDIHDDISSEFGTANDKIEGKRGPDMLGQQLAETECQEQTGVPDCDKDASLCVTQDEVKDITTKTDDKDDNIKVANNDGTKSVNIQPSEKVVLSGTKTHESCETETKVLRSRRKSSNDNSDTNDLAIHKNTLNISTEGINETNDAICDKDNDNTPGDVSERVCESSAGDTDKVQTSRQLSTGFVVSSPHSDRLSESPSPSNVLDKDKLDKRKLKLKGPGSLCDTVLEQIEEEDSPKDSSEEDISSSDVSTARSTKVTPEITKPGCSFHYNETEDDDEDLSLSLSLSEEIEKIMDKKPSQTVSRVISCTPDMLDSETGELSESVSRTESPSGETIERTLLLSPLPISPFDFIIPISPLPPSPVNEIELDRVSPLSPDNFDSQVDNIELEQNISEVHSGSREVLHKPHIAHTLIEDFKFSVPDSLSPIKTPERKTCNNKLNKSKSSAFKKVSSIDNQSVDITCSKLGNSTVVKETTTNQKHSSRIPEQAEAPLKQLSKKAVKLLNKNQIDKAKELVTKALNEDCVNSSTETSVNLKPEVTTHNNPELKIKPPSDEVVKNSTISEKENQTENMVQTESAVDVVSTDVDVSTGHDNLVAVKKKTRLAHKPNIQTLKPQKIQIIEAPALPMVTSGRKRRSLDSGDKDAQEKKQCKASTFQKQKLVDKNLVLSKEGTKRMQVFLKSTELPDSFVTKVTESGDTGVSRLLDSCIECLGRIRTDTTDIVYQQCLSDAYRSLQLQWPFMSDVEKQATKLLKYLYTQTHLNISYKDVMMRLWGSIFGRNLSVNVVGQMCFCRVFTALSSLEGDVEQARVLFYHIVSCGHLSVRQFVVPVVSVWPEVLKKSEFDRPDKSFSHSLLLVLEEVVTRTLLSEDLEVNKKVVLILQKLCGWKGSCGDTEIILRTLLQRLAEISTNKPDSQDCVLEIEKGVHLLSVTGGWPWFKEFFIMRHGLQPVTTKYLAKSANKPVSPVCVNTVLRITGSVTQALSATAPGKEIDHFTRFWMFPLINSEDADPVISKCCIEVLLELSPLQPTILKGVHSWFMKQAAAVQNEVRGKLEAIRKQYQSRHSLVSESFL